MPSITRAVICSTLLLVCSLPILAQDSLEPSRKGPGQESAPAPEARPAEPVAPLPLELRSALAGITSARVMQHIVTLTSPELEGREAGERGALLGASYVAREFRRAGLRPGGGGGSFYQAFPLSAGATTAQLGIVTSASSLHVLERAADFELTHLPKREGKAEVAIEGPVELVGYGLQLPAIGFDSYRERDLKGKVALVFAGAPWGAEANRWLGPLVGKEGLLVAKARAAAKAGAVGLLVVEDPAGWRRSLGFESELRPLEGAFPSGVTIPVVNVTPEAATRLSGVSGPRLSKACFEARRTRRPVRGVRGVGHVARLRARVARPGRFLRNVIGVLVGSDPDLRHEAVVIGAHLDHLGVDSDGLHGGANDNASGISALVEIARALGSLSPARLPRRSVVLVAFDGEEIGRLGSAYYTAHPPIPLERTRLMINFDMIGGNDPDQIWAVASRSSEVLHGLHQEANRHVGLRLKHPKSFRLGRSDHTAFYRAGIPILYFFGGLNAQYHTPQDTLEHMSCAKVARVAKLAMLTAWETANRIEPLPFHKPR